MDNPSPMLEEEPSSPNYLSRVPLDVHGIISKFYSQDTQVFAVLQEDNYGTHLLQIFSTHDKAMAYVKACIARDPNAQALSPDHFKSLHYEIYIHPFVLDPPFDA